ncbi:MAG TPA: hypothetical protein VLW17_00115 [Thermoanaerobaculaceae bacterium]|nr:hypothetical protein [Thermoanaerobaculaceae bacterium]
MRATSSRRPSRRAGSLGLALLVLLGAASATFHSHSPGVVEGDAGLAPRVPVSVIANPDSPGLSFHLHAGTIVEGEACPACVLSSAHGVVPARASTTQLCGSANVMVAAVSAPPEPAAVAAGSRSPPLVA